MKKLSLILCCLSLVFSASAVFVIEFKKISVSEHAETWVHVDSRGTEWSRRSLIPGLEENLFQTLKIVDSPAPSWADKDEEFLTSKYDIETFVSYWDERWESFQEICDFNDDDWDYAEGSFHFEWSAVNEIKGSSSPVMYIVDQVTVLDTGSEKCEIVEAEYLFLNKKDESGSSIFLGERIYKSLD